MNGLEYLHNEGIVHRDIKPSNVLIKDNYDVKLADFGTAKIIDWKDTRILRFLKEREEKKLSNFHNWNRKGTFVGTHEYISPEVINSEEVTPLVDIWGIGIIIYEMLHGSTPFIGINEMLTYKNISEGNIKFRDGIDPSAKDFIVSCLKVNIEDRLGYQEEGIGIDYVKIKSHKFFKDIDFDNLNPSFIKGLTSSTKPIISGDLSTEKSVKMNHIRMKIPNQNSEAFSTMDSSTNPKFWIDIKDLR